MQETVINIGLIALSMFFILTGAARFMRGRQSRVRRFAYDVGRMDARGSAFMAYLQGFALTAIGLGLFMFWAFYNPGASIAEPEVAAAPTPLPTETQVRPTIALASGSDAEIDPTATDVPIVLAEPEPTAVVTLPPATSTPLPAPIVPITPAVPTEIPLPTATPGPATDGTVDIIGGLYLRDAPNGEVVVLLDNGSGLFFLGASEENGAYTWIEVEAVTGEVGWVAQDFVQTE